MQLIFGTNYIVDHWRWAKMTAPMADCSSKDGNSEESEEDEEKEASSIHRHWLACNHRSCSNPNHVTFGDHFSFRARFSVRWFRFVCDFCSVCFRFLFGQAFCFRFVFYRARGREFQCQIRATPRLWRSLSRVKCSVSVREYIVSFLQYISDCILYIRLLLRYLR